MTIHTPTTSNTTGATTTAYALLQAAPAAADARVYIEIENIDSTNNLIVATGAAASEVALATILPGTSKKFSPVAFANLGFNTVPQGRLSIKGSAGTPNYNATIVTSKKITLA